MFRTLSYYWSYLKDKWPSVGALHGERTIEKYFRFFMLSLRWLIIALEVPRLLSTVTKLRIVQPLNRGSFTSQGRDFLVSKATVRLSSDSLYTWSFLPVGKAAGVWCWLFTHRMRDKNCWKLYLLPRPCVLMAYTDNFGVHVLCVLLLLTCPTVWGCCFELRISCPPQ